MWRTQGPFYGSIYIVCLMFRISYLASCLKNSLKLIITNKTNMWFCFRHKSPLRIQKGSVANSYYNKSDKRPISPDSRNGSGDRRRAGRNWDRGGKSWEARKTDRDKRRERGVNSRFKKEVPKIEKPNTLDENEVQTFPQKTDNPVLEARRKKFESNDLVEPASKKIRLRNSPVREKPIESVEVQTEPEEVVSKPETDDLDLDLEDDILDLGAELWSSDEGEPLVKRNGNTSRKVIRPPSPKKKKPVKERITLDEKGTSKYITITLKMAVHPVKIFFIFNTVSISY